MPLSSSKINNDGGAATTILEKVVAASTPTHEDDCLLTPQSHNRGGGPSTSSMDELISNGALVADAPEVDTIIPPLMILSSAGGDRISSSRSSNNNYYIHPSSHSNTVVEERNGSEEIMELLLDDDNHSEDQVLKSYSRKLSALSGSTPTGNSADSYDDELQLQHNHYHQTSLLASPTAMAESNADILNDDYDTPRFSSSLSFVENKKLQTNPPEMMILAMDDIEIKAAKSSGDHSNCEIGSSSVFSVATSRAVIVGDDEVTETSFTTMTTEGGGDSMIMMAEFGGPQLLYHHPLPSSPPVMAEQQFHPQQQQQHLQQRSSLPSLLLSSRRGGGSGIRSPRPSRRMRAVDWCPNAIGGGGGGGTNSIPSLDKTVASTRAVRLGDDATVTTFATLTTMGDAGSTTLLMEGEMEDGTTASSDDEMLQEGEEEEEEMEEEKEDNQSMMLEDVKEENIVGAFVVDKIPRSSYKKKLRTQQLSMGTGKSKQTSLSGTTNRAVRGSTLDDQYSVVTFATMATAGGGVSIMENNAQEVVDKVPSLLATTKSTSIVTNDTVLMGDNQSLATWATTNTMGGQLTGNVIDHVPTSMGAGIALSLSSSNVTLGTSNAVRDEASVMTFTTSAAADDISEINEMVDKIPTFAGGRGNGRSIASGITSQAVLERKIFSGGDDRSVTSFATMTTMGDLGSIVETAEDLEDDDAEISNSFLQLRPRVFLNHDSLDRRSALVDVIPEAASSVASDTTNHSIGASVATFGTLTTAGGRVEQIMITNEDAAMVDHVPNCPIGGEASIMSGTTNHAIRSNDDQSVATWLTTTTSGIAKVLGSNMSDQIVDEIPSFNDEGHAGVNGSYEQSESVRTNQAVRDAEDQSVVTWNTMTTTNIGGGNDLPGPYAVDRLPSFSSRWSALAGTSISGMTNHAVRAGGGDDQSVVTFATVTTVGMDRRIGGSVNDNMVDKVPSFASPWMDAASIITNETVQMGGNQSLMTWATTYTLGGPLTGNVVDHVPEADMAASDGVKNDAEDVTLGTTNAVKEDPSVTTFTTSATSGGRVSCINEVVDRIPTFAGGSGQSVTSGITHQAVRMGDDRSLASFATMTTTGCDPGSIESSGSSKSNRRIRYPSNSQIVDQIPSSATTVLTERTDYAVRLGDDLTEATLTTVTMATGEGGQSAVKYPNSDQIIVDQLPSSTRSSSDAVRLGDDLTEATFATITSLMVGNDGTTTAYSGVEDNNDVLSRSSTSARSLSATAPPTTGILRESRHRPSSALKSAFESVATEPNELPIDIGESVSNTHILRAIADLRFHVDYRIGDLREVNRRDSERGN